jgi:hypothetical protein
VDGSSTEFGLRAARKLVEAKDHEWPLYVEGLRRNKELSAVTRQLNRLLELPEHRQVAIDAFKRIGLWHDELVMPRRIRGGVVPMQDRLVDEMAHLLEMDEPMAAAGAELSGLHVKGETKQALERATRLESPAHQKK